MKTPVTAIPRSTHSERRRYRRYELSLTAVAVLSDKLEVPIQLHELSRTGFLMDCDGPLGVGEPLAIRLDGIGEFAARTIWACGSLIGCEFQSKLASGACSEALLKARPAMTKPSNHLWIEERQRSDAISSALMNDVRARKRIVALTITLSMMFWASVTVTLFG